MARMKLKLNRPVTEVVFDIDEHSLESTGWAKIVRCRECRWGTMCVTGQHLGLDGFCSKGEREAQE